VAAAPDYYRGHGFRQAVSKSTGLTVSDPAKASNHRRYAPSFTSLEDEAYIGSGENGKRYRRHHPASQTIGPGLPVLILTIPDYHPVRSSANPITTTVQP
jgi:hypothetical protein